MRLVALAIATLSLLGLPAVASGDSFEYLTTYAGIYDFTQDEVAQPGLPDGLHSAQQYVWVTFDYNHVTVRDDGTYTSRHTRFISAHGHVKIVQIQGSALTGGPFTTTTDCTIKSALTPVVTEGTGSNVDPIPISRDPSINVSWEIPDYGSKRASDAPPFTLQGTAAGQPCATQQSNSFLLWTDTSPGATVFTPLPPTTLMRDAFGGAATIRYHDITGKYGLWRRQFKIPPIKNTASRPGFHGDATETAEVKVDSEVTFRRMDHKSQLNKIGALLQSEGFLGADFQGLPAGPADPNSDDPDEQILVPGVGTGDESLDVSGRVISGQRAMAAASSLIASGSGKATGSSRPVRITLRLTAAGRARLAAPHPAIPVLYRLRFRPHGSTKTYTATKTFTIPATR